MKTALFSLLFGLLSMSLLAQNPGFTVILPEAKGDINDTVWQKDYFGHFSLQNTGKDTLFLSQAQLTPFADVQSGPPVAARLSLGEKRRDSIAIPSGQVVRIGIDASFKQVGAYLAIFTAQTRQDTAQSILTRKIRVLRKLRKAKSPRAFFAIQDIVRATGDMSGIHLRVVVQDTAGYGGTLLAPLVTLQRKLSDTENGQAAYTRIRVSDTLGQTLKQLDFEPSEAKTLLVQVEGLAEPGTYNGKFAVTSTDGPAADKPFVVTARRAWWIALLWITAGLLLSLVGRWLKQVIQPRLERQNRVAALIERAKALEPHSAQQQHELVVLANLQRQLAELYDVLARETPQDWEDRVKVLDQKLHLLRVWIAAGRAVYALQPVSLQNAFLPKLDAARDFIKGYGGTSEKATELEKSLQAIDDEILAAVSAHIDGEVRRLVAGMKVGHLEFSPEELEQLEARANALTSIKPNNQVQMTVKNAGYDEFRLVYTDGMIEKLKAEFAQGPPAAVKSLGVSEGSWQEATQAALAELESLSGAAQIEEKLVAMLRGLKNYALHLTELSLNKVAEILAYNENLSPENRAVLIKNQTLLENNLATIRAVNAEGNTYNFPPVPTDLSEVLEAAMPTKEFLPRSMTMRGNTLAIDGDLNRAENLAFQVPRTVHFSPVASLDTGTDSEETNIWLHRAKMFLSDLASSTLILAISGLLGLLILWNANPTWGSTEDILYAILWGFGLHTVSKTTDLSSGPMNLVGGKLKPPAS